MKTFEHSGWFLEAYPDPGHGVTVWLLDDHTAEGQVSERQADDHRAGERFGARRRLKLDFPVTMYAAGRPETLRAAWRWLAARPETVTLARAERRDLFAAALVPVMAIQTPNPSQQPALFAHLAGAFPTLTFYDADIPLALRLAAIYNLFPLCRCQVSADENGHIRALASSDSPWQVEPDLPPLRLLAIEPDADPQHAPPKCLRVRGRRLDCRLSLEPARPLLVNLSALLRTHDPDLLLTQRGDTWLLPRLLELSRQWRIPLPLNRHSGRGILYRPERTYFAYGQVIYRGQQAHLFGRWHIDCANAVMYHDYGLEGIFELARVTALPVQTVARVSPGTGISAMQIITALRLGVLVPWRKQQAERPKTAAELLHADQGGLVYQPLTGLHRHVGEIDFVSMYPSIMARFNISPETIGRRGPTAELTPALEALADRQQPGLVPQTLAPLLEKRLALKARLAALPRWDPRREVYKARASAHKWLLVTCFGYLGYKNARFGRIEAHEAVTAYGREILLRAKEAAEDLGFTVLHLYVDGLWIQQAGCAARADFQAALEAIAARTGISIALEGVYRWIAFLPSRRDARLPVANRYFGVFQDGTIKVRGIEARRRDTPPFIAQAQMELLARLAQLPPEAPPTQALPQLLGLLGRRVKTLQTRRVPLEQLLVTQTLSRTLAEYRLPSPAARAAAQLEAVGKTLRPGQWVRFLYTLGRPGVYAWDLPDPPDPATLHLACYHKLLLRAAATIFQPLGLDEAALRDRLAACRQPALFPETP